MAGKTMNDNRTGGLNMRGASEQEAAAAENAGKEHFTAIVLAAGKGSRMGTAVEKQFLTLRERPLICYCLDTFQASDAVDEIILVTEASRIDYCRTEIVDRWHYSKVTAVVAGGKERYDSVYQGLLACPGTDYVYIHDGARIFVTDRILKDGRVHVQRFGSAVAAVPSKDTVKIADADGLVSATPNRKNVWIIQTPQIFRYDIVREAYDRMQGGDRTGITDDAMVVEQYGASGKNEVYLYKADYRNIKITTPDDLPLAEMMLQAEA